MQEVFTLEKIYQAYLDCRIRKKNTANALRFEMDREENLIELLKELKSRKYEISRHIYFIIKEPAPREIFAADFRDRVVHHLLYNEISYLFEDDFIDNSFANRLGKGTHKGVEKLKEYLKSASKDSYFLKLDVKSFFCTIDKGILFKIVFKKIMDSNKSNYWKENIIWLCHKIIFHDPIENCVFRGSPENKNLIPKEKSLFFSQGKGLPIGNLTSQFFANVYLDCLDHFIKDDLRVEKYIRYVDDIIIIGESKDCLGKYIGLAEDFLKTKLGLKLKRRKTILRPIRQGIDFLGYYVRRGYVLIRQKVVSRLKNRVRHGELFDIKVLSVINSYLGHFKHGNAYGLRKKIINEDLSKLKGFIEISKDYLSIRQIKCKNV